MIKRSFAKLIQQYEKRTLVAGTTESVIAQDAQKDFFRSHDQTKIYFEDTGGSGPILFFLYGLGCNISHWKYQMAYFLEQKKSQSKDYRIIWIEYRGHGHSERPAEQPITLEQIADDIIALVRHLKIKDKIFFLGQSMGGNVALLVAKKKPSICAALTLQGSPPKGPSQTSRIGPAGKALWKSMAWLNHQKPQAVKEIYKAFPFIAGRTFQELVRYIGFNPKLVHNQDVEEYVNGLIACDGNVFWDLAYDMESFDIKSFGKRIKVPILIIAGAKDHCVTLKNVEQLAQELPSSSLYTMQHGSHCPHLDDPDHFNQVVDVFINGK